MRDPVTKNEVIRDFLEEENEGDEKRVTKSSTHVFQAAKVVAVTMDVEDEQPSRIGSVGVVRTYHND